MVHGSDSGSGSDSGIGIGIDIDVDIWAQSFKPKVFCSRWSGMLVPVPVAESMGMGSPILQ